MGVPQGSVLGHLFFLIHINNLAGNVTYDINLFADDTSLFKIVLDEAKASLDLNNDLEAIRLWTCHWKLQFNAKKTEEVIFSTKRKKPQHLLPLRCFSNLQQGPPP